MATIGILNLLFSADTAALTKGVGNVRDQLKTAHEHWSIGKEDALKFFAVVSAGAAAAGAGLAVWVKTSMDAINSTRVLGERIGTSSEALSRLQYAAKISDVDIDTLAGSLQKMQKNLGEIATTGSGKAAAVLDKFGLSAAKLAAQDPVETFHSLVSVLGQIQNPAERMKAAVDIFGKSAQGVLNMAVQGADGIKAMEDEADRLGITFNDIDAAKVDEADDAMTAIWETISGVGKSLAIELAPWITEVANKFKGWAEVGVDGGSRVTQSIDWVINAFGYMGDVIQVAQTAFYGFRAVFLEGFSYIVAGIDKVINAFGYLYEKVTGNKMELTTFFKDWSEGLEGAATKDLGKAGNVWGKEWAHNTIRAFTDEIKSGAESRAVQAVEKAKKFRGGRGEDIEMAGKAEHATKAMQFGSAEAANTILRTKFGEKNGKDIPAVANNTKRAADTLDRLLAYWEEIGGDKAEVMDFI